MPFEDIHKKFKESITEQASIDDVYEVLIGVGISVEACEVIKGM